MKRLLCAGLAVSSLWPFDATAQDAGRPYAEIGAQAIGVVTRESPAIHGRDLTEGYLVQPLLMLQAGIWNDALALRTSIDFEGAIFRPVIF